MRTDSQDGFGTRLEQRCTEAEIASYGREGNATSSFSTWHAGCWRSYPRTRLERLPGPRGRAGAVTALAENAALRKTMGAEGRWKIEQAYSLAVHGPRLAGMLPEVMEESRLRRAKQESAGLRRGRCAA